MIELQIYTNKKTQDITVEDLCHLRDEFDKFMQVLATEVINNKK